MFEESISQFVNPAKEEASLDTRTGAAWSGFETDDVTREMCALQPVETILWERARTDADARLCAIAADCIAGRAPSLVPVDESEKIRFRSVWQYCSDVNSDKEGGETIQHHPFIFSSALGVFARDVFIRASHVSRFVTVLSFCACPCGSLAHEATHSPLSVFETPKTKVHPISLLLSMQMCVLAASGYLRPTAFSWPFAVTVGGDAMGGQTFFDETGNAALMVAMRSKTEWYREHMKTMPF